MDAHSSAVTVQIFNELIFYSGSWRRKLLLINNLASTESNSTLSFRIRDVSGRYALQIDLVTSGFRESNV